MTQLPEPNALDANDGLILIRAGRVGYCLRYLRFETMNLNSPVATSVKSRPARISIRPLLRREPAFPADGSLFTGTVAGYVSAVVSFSDGLIAPNVARWGNALAAFDSGVTTSTFCVKRTFLFRPAGSGTLLLVIPCIQPVWGNLPYTGPGFSFFCSINPWRKP